MEDIIGIAIIVIIVLLAGLYVYKAKKNGKKCIGCPDGCSCSTTEKKKDEGAVNTCSGCCSCCSGCSTGNDTE